MQIVKKIYVLAVFLFDGASWRGYNQFNEARRSFEAFLVEKPIFYEKSCVKERTQYVPKSALVAS